MVKTSHWLWKKPVQWIKPALVEIISTMDKPMSYVWMGKTSEIFFKKTVGMKKTKGILHAYMKKTNVHGKKQPI